MGNLNSSVGDLVLMALNDDSEAENLKAERKKALLEQKNNFQTLKQKLGSYRAKMASQGAGSLNEGVTNGLIDQMDKENQALADAFNRKLKEKTRANRQKALLTAGNLIKSATGGFAQK